MKFSAVVVLAFLFISASALPLECSDGGDTSEAVGEDG
jgi:hypothetical protein